MTNPAHPPNAAAMPNEQEFDHIERECRRFVGFIPAADAIAALRERVRELENALDMATQGKYSELMLKVADGRAKQIHAGIQVGLLKGELLDANARAEANEKLIA